MLAEQKETGISLICLNPSPRRKHYRLHPSFSIIRNLDLDTHRIGIFGKFCAADTVLKAGDRVEIYLPVQRQADEDEDDDA